MPGTKLQGGAFSLGKILGQGGFGITYLGSDVRLRRAVAIKEFFPQGCSRCNGTVRAGGGLTVADFQSAKVRFLQEAQILAQFQHAGIVQVYASFEENNTAYMVMDFLKGKTLLKLLEQSGPIPEREAISYIARVGEALEVVHRANLLHRDVKPENIIVTDDGRVVLLDFGTAREFAGGKTRQMTAMLTVGYAPLEQYTGNARFGAFTDVYALGGTLYHLLTGTLPVPATDRVAGQALPPPHRLNSEVSQVVSDAVMWALEIKVDKRPQSVREFLQALQGGPNPNRNPYEGQIREVLLYLAKQPQDAPAASSHDPRINEINRHLSGLNRLPSRKAGSCPACDQAQLNHITGEASGRCPLCRQGDLTPRRFESDRCPVCRTGQLIQHPPRTKHLCCPVCRNGFLEEEERTRLLFLKEVWWVCSGCKAQFQVTGVGEATLAEFQHDPYEVGRRYQGRTLSAKEWHRLAVSGEQYWQCNRCSARLDDVGEGRRRLSTFISDPYSVGRQLIGKSLSLFGWAKLAQGLPLRAGNSFCPSCRAEFIHDASKETLELLDLGSGNSRWEAWLTSGASRRAFPLTNWYSAASGKRSLQAGWLCPACNAEFDDKSAGLEAVWLPPGPLSPFVNEVHSLDDWYRRASGVPTAFEEKQLREELVQLLRFKQQEHAEVLRLRQQHLSRLEEELTRLLKQAVIEGYYPLRLQSAQLSLREQETVHWEGPGWKLKQRTARGITYWDRDVEGTLLVTSERILLDSPPHKLWHRPLSKLLRVDQDQLPRGTVIVLCLDGLQKPVGLWVEDLPLSVSVEGQTRPIRLDPGDLARLLQTLAGKGK
jgi:serine/threonine protein kinase